MSRERTCNIGNALNFKALMQVLSCASSGHQILQLVTYLSNVRKLLACVSAICPWEQHKPQDSQKQISFCSS